MVKSLQQLYRWEASVERGGTNADKLAFIAEYVQQKFEEACDRRSIVPDMNLRLWALGGKNSRWTYPNTWQVNGWIWNFKTAHRIVSRKITTFRTQFTFEEILTTSKILQNRLFLV